MDNTTGTQADILTVIRTRKWSIIGPFAAIFLTAVFIAFVLPPVYRATTTILIEQQDVPVDFVRTTVSTYAEQQMQIINQRIMSSTRLLEIINKLSLYPDLRDRLMTEEIVEQMREDISLEPISVNVVDPRTGRPTAVTIAFTISYQGEKDPAKVLQVANVLASLFLEENTMVRERQASEVSRFLQEELDRVKVDLERVDDAIARFKEQHMNDLPELVQVNMQSIADVQRNIDMVNNQLNQLREKEGYLRSQLANTPREFMETDRQQLNQLNVKLVNLKQHFSEEHPDVIKTRSEIRDLEKRIRESSGSQDKSRPDNPAYITLAAQLTSVQAEMASVTAQLRDLNTRMYDYKRRIELSPQVESEYKRLLSERNNTQMKYDDLMRKFMESKVSQGLEKDQKGERFTIIDPARQPEKPYKPNRLLIMLIGLVLGAGAGVGTASYREFTDMSARSATQLARATSYPVLASIPTIVLDADTSRRKSMWTWIAAGVGAAGMAGLVVFHVFVMDLYVFWAKLLRWLGV